MKRYGSPRTIVTGRLRSYGAAMKELGNIRPQGRSVAISTTVPRTATCPSGDRRAISRFRRMSNLQNLASTHASLYNRFNLDHHLNPRFRFRQTLDAALLEWRQISAA